MAKKHLPGCEGSVKGFDNYLIFYAPTADGVEVYHVLHGARNLEWFRKGH